MKKIVYLITLPDLGGAQSHLYEVISRVGNFGYEAVLVTGKEGWLTHKVREAGIKVEIVADLVRQISPFHDIKAYLEICQILREKKPDLLHCHSSKAGILGRLAAKRCGIPAVFTAHGWAFTDGVSPKKRWLYRHIENYVAYMTKKIVCVSEYDRQLGMRALPNYADRMVTIHNGIPDVPLQVRDWQSEPIHCPLRIVVVARFSPQKKI